MGKQLICAILVLTIVYICYAQKTLTGKCQKPKGMTDFKAKKIEGIWYAQELFENYVRCLKWNITRNEKSNTWIITESKGSGFFYNIGLGQIILSKGSLEQQKNNTGEFTVTWNLNIGGSYDFVVLYSDYNNILIIFSCQNMRIFGSHRQQAMILSRGVGLRMSILQQARMKFVQIGVEVQYLGTVDHTNCHELPELPPTNYGPIADYN